MKGPRDKGPGPRVNIQGLSFLAPWPLALDPWPFSPHRDHILNLIIGKSASGVILAVLSVRECGPRSGQDVPTRPVRQIRGILNEVRRGPGSDPHKLFKYYQIYSTKAGFWPLEPRFHPQNQDCKQRAAPVMYIRHYFLCEFVYA